MTLTEKIDRFRAGIVDAVSFGFVNVLQKRHALPSDFLRLWENYTGHWATRPLEEFYALPENFNWPEFPGSGRWSFPSPVQGNFAPNNRAGFDLYPCAAGWSAPTMVLAHGLMSVSDFGYRLWARRLNALGWNAVFMHLPYHYSRRLPWHLHGELAVGAHLVRTAEGIRQAVLEMRVLLQTLKRQGGRLFGGWGTSYGGWIVALAACAEPLLQRVILVEPILKLESAIWTSPASVTVRSGLRRAGLTREGTRDHLRLCCPTYQKPQTDGKHVLLIAGEYDRIAPPEEVAQLHRQWEGSHFHVFKQGHVGYTLMPESFRMAQELWPQDFAGDLPQSGITATISAP
jgi:dienelactone hydrolase